MQVTVKLPSLLGQITGNRRQVNLRATTLAQALQALIEWNDALGVHLFDENGDLREHVLCFHNDQNSRWMETLEVELQEGDTITIVQAVSGG